jgi:hypothetical protein
MKSSRGATTIFNVCVAPRGRRQKLVALVALKSQCCSSRSVSCSASAVFASAPYINPSRSYTAAAVPAYLHYLHTNAWLASLSLSHDRSTPDVLTHRPSRSLPHRPSPSSFPCSSYTPPPASPPTPRSPLHLIFYVHAPFVT